MQRTKLNKGEPMIPFFQLSCVRQVYRLLILCTLAIALFAFSNGCNDNLFEPFANDGGPGSKIEDARIALDDGNHEKAKAILLNLESSRPDDPVVLQYLSNACAGMIGLDTYRLLEVVDKLNENDNTGAIDMAGLVLGDENGILTATEIQNKLELLEDCAIPKLLRISSPTDEHLVQLGLVSLHHAILLIGDIVVEERGISAIKLTEEGLRDLYRYQAFVYDLTGDPRMEKLSDDIMHISRSVDAILEISGDPSAEDNDLAENFDAFIDGIDQDRDGAVSPVELINYINEIINGGRS